MSNRACGAAFGLLLLFGATACFGATPAGVGLTCQVAPTGKMPVDAEEICGAFRSALTESLGRAVSIVPDHAHSLRGGWLQVKITSPRRGALQADYSGSIGPRKFGPGPIVVEVIDKALGRNEVDKLARAVAKAIAAR